MLHGVAQGSGYTGADGVHRILDYLSYLYTFFMFDRFGEFWPEVGLHGLQEE